MTAPTAHGDRTSGSNPGLKQGLLFSVMSGVVVLHVVFLTALVIFSLASPDSVDEADGVTEIAARTDVVAAEFSFTVSEHPSGSPIEMTLDNQGAIFHNLEIEGVAGFVLEADSAEQAVGVVELPAGTWVMYCSVPGHREAGMEADLIVGG